MTRIRLPRIPTSFVPAAAIALAIVLAGCAGRVQTVHETAGFTRTELAAGGVAVGGVVLSARLAAAPAAELPEGVPVDDVLAQADAWAGALYGALLDAGAGGTVWPWTAVRDACQDSALATVLVAFARGGLPRPDQVTALAGDLAQVRYLALARVDDERTELRGDPEAALRQQRIRDGREPHANARDNGLTTRRTMTVTLDVYDLATGRSVWTATAERHRDELYNYTEAGATKEPGVVPEGQPVITAQGKPLPMPEFLDVVGDACGAAARRLLGEPQS